MSINATSHSSAHEVVGSIYHNTTPEELAKKVEESPWYHWTDQGYVNGSHERTGGMFHAMMLAARVGNIRVMRYLYQQGGIYLVNLPNSYGTTPLFHAVSTGQERAVEVLLEMRADVNLGREPTLTPLWAAVKSNNVAMQKLLVQNGARFDEDVLQRLPEEEQAGLRELAGPAEPLAADVSLSDS